MKLHPCFSKIGGSDEIKLGSLSSSRKPGTGGGHLAAGMPKGRPGLNNIFANAQLIAAGYKFL